MPVLHSRRDVIDVTRSEPLAPASRLKNGSRTPATRRVLNVPWLVGTLVVLLLLAPTVYGWYVWQTRRISRAFLDRADALEKESEFAAAADYLYRYVRLEPRDDEARGHLARVYDRSAQDLRRQRRAVDLYYYALGVAADDQQGPLRRRLTELLLGQGRYAEAETEAHKLMKANPDSDAKRLLALALYGQSRTGALAGNRARGTTVGEVVEQALQANPHNIELATILARIYREQVSLLSPAQQRAVPKPADQAQRADTLMDAMVAANPKDVSAVLARYRYRAQYHVSGAEQDLKAAVELDPQNVAIRLAAGEWAMAEARRVTAQPARADLRRQALEHFQQVRDIDPSNEAGQLGAGEVYLSQGEIEQALRVWREGLRKVDKDSVGLNARLSEVLIEQGRLDEAEQSLQRLDRVLQKPGTRWSKSRREAVQSTLR